MRVEEIACAKALKQKIHIYMYFIYIVENQRDGSSKPEAEEKDRSQIIKGPSPC